MTAILSSEVKCLPKVAYLVQEYDEILDMELNVVIFLNSNKADEFVQRAKERDKDDRYYYDICEVPLNECSIREETNDDFKRGVHAAMDIIDAAGLEADYDTLTLLLAISHKLGKLIGGGGR